MEGRHLICILSATDVELDKVANHKTRKENVACNSSSMKGTAWIDQVKAPPPNTFNQF